MSKTESAPEQQKKGFSGADYNYVAMNAELRIVSLVKTTFSVNADCISRQDAWALSYDIGEIASRHDPDRRVVSSIFQYQVLAKLGRKNAMKCTAEYVVLYIVPADCDGEAARGFCHNVGRFAAYPYFRGLVAQLASGSNLILPPLPNIASNAHVPKPQQLEES